MFEANSLRNPAYNRSDDEDFGAREHDRGHPTLTVQPTPSSSLYGHRYACLSYMRLHLCVCVCVCVYARACVKLSVVLVVCAGENLTPSLPVLASGSHRSALNGAVDLHLENYLERQRQHSEEQGRAVNDSDEYFFGAGLCRNWTHER